MIYINYEQLDNKIGRACHEEYALTYEQIKGYMETSDQVNVIESRWIEEAFDDVSCERCEIVISKHIRGYIAGTRFPFNYCPNCGAKMKFVEVGKDG